MQQDPVAQNPTPAANLQPLPPTPSQPPTQPTVVAPSQVAEYAGIWTRFFATCIDGLILSVIAFVINLLGTLVGGLLGENVSSIVTLLLGIVNWGMQIVYYIYFIGSRGQTLGKMALKIKVIKADTGEVPGYTTAFLRETVGKLVSGLVLGIGYVVAFKDPKKQSWHDKIANTVVVKA